MMVAREDIDNSASLTLGISYEREISPYLQESDAIHCWAKNDRL